MSEFAQCFIALLAPVFPSGAELRALPSREGLQISVSWKLMSDPARKNKRSRRIIMLLSEEALEDYVDGDLHTRNTIEGRIVHFATERVKSFNPNHETPYGRPEPEELWYLT